MKTSKPNPNPKKKIKTKFAIKDLKPAKEVKGSQWTGVLSGTGKAT